MRPSHLDCHIGAILGKATPFSIKKKKTREFSHRIGIVVIYDDDMLDFAWIDELDDENDDIDDFRV